MAEGILLWKRAVLWPRFSVGRGKGLVGNYGLALCVIYAILQVPALFHVQDWPKLLGLPIIYGVTGLILWLIAIFQYLWSYVKKRHPRTARTADAITFVVAWEVRVLASNDPSLAPFRLWAGMIIVLGEGAYVAMRLNYLSLRTAIILWCITDGASLVTGLYLAHKRLVPTQDQP